MESKWKKVFSSNQEYKVALVEQFLSNNGIQSVQFNKKDSAYTLGEIELFVTQENVLRASHLIKNHFE